MERNTKVDETVEELDALSKGEEKEEETPSEADLLEKAILDMEEFDEELAKSGEEKDEGEPTEEELAKAEKEREELVNEHGEELVAATEAYEEMTKSVKEYAERTEERIGDQNAALADLTTLTTSLAKAVVTQSRNVEGLVKSMEALKEENGELKKSLEELGQQPQVPGAQLGIGRQPGERKGDPDLPEKGEVISALSKAIQDDRDKYGHLSSYMSRISTHGVNENTFPKTIFTDSLCEEIGLRK